MKFTLSWLKDHLDTTADLNTISETLTAIGLEVEDIQDPGATLKDFIVASIEEAEQHPQADKLRVCKVNDGTSTRQVVCGAPNARAGINVILAREGVVIPTNDMKIKKSAIRGVESNGMLCSARELGLGDDHAGIMELPADAKLGTSIVPLLGLDDPVIEIAITPNRGDCLGIRGIARDLAAAGIGTLKPLKHNALKGEFKSSIDVAITDSQGCPMFTGRTIKGVKNGPSPDWLQNRLKAIGLRPISTLVDITNYISFEYGRPLHVYDAKLVKGTITARDAKAGEKFMALNDKEYEVKPGMTVIADDSGVVGLGGVIGGASTGVNETTTDVFLEAALFNPIAISNAGRALDVQTDARYRFERGVDPDFIIPGAEIAAQMILDLCGGTASELVVVGKAPEWRRQIRFRPERLKTFGGVDLPAAKANEILQSLGCTISGDQVTPPSWRPDIHGEADLVEEVLRIHRFDNLPTTPLPKPDSVAKTMLTPSQRRDRATRRLLATRGMVECHNWGFTQSNLAELFGGRKDELTLLNPINAELDHMRPSLLPNLLLVTARNIARGFADLALFEVGNQFENPTPTGQKLVASGIRSGSAETKTPHTAARAYDIYDIKADALAILEAFGVPASKVQIDRSAPAWYHPGRSGTLTLGGKVKLGHFGEIHPAILQQLDIKPRVMGFEIFLEAIPQSRAKTGKTKATLQASDFQPVRRDFAFVVDAGLPVGDLLKAIEGADKLLVKNVNVFDIYQGKGVDDGKKSVAIAVTLQAMDRTLTDAEIDAVAKQVIAGAQGLGAALRS